jgi:hypothetical protein
MKACWIGKRKFGGGYFQCRFLIFAPIAAITAVVLT